MSTIWLAPAAQLLAAAADAATDDRVRSGLAVPYGVYGNTSAGRLRVRAGAIRIPADLGVVKLLSGHRNGPVEPTPVGYLTGAEDTPDGLNVDLHFARTAAGDAALLEADERVREALSVELDNLETTGDEVTGADLVALALIPVPAYTAARLAAENTQPPIEESLMPDQSTLEAPAPPAPDQLEAPAPALAAAATVPPNLPRPGGDRPGEIRTMRELYAALTAAHTGNAGRGLQAALQNITRTANAWVQPTQYEGELWTGVGYQRVIVPLVSPGTLTGWTVSGWRWKTPPVVAPYTGDKTAVPSNAAVTEPVTTNAERLAGAHDFDRKFRDFGDVGFFESYYRAMTESYALLSDTACLAALNAAAAVIAPITTGTAWQAILALAMSLPANTGGATFAVVGAGIAMAMAGTTAANAPASLELVGGLPKVVYSPLQAPGAILVGAKAGATFYELPGSPIRVEAVDMVNGGVDGGVFGYYADIINSATAFAKTSYTAPAAQEASAQEAPAK